ncbi:MAG: FtsX-like permease family protein [Candidatus Limnocylindrales bacterium]
MRRFSSLAWRSLGSRKLRSVLTTVGIALGVAVLFASLSAGATMDAAVNRAAADEMGHADLRVQALEERGLSSATVAVVESAAGVAVAAPALERKTYESARLNQTPASQLPPPVTVLGIDPVREPQLHDMPLASGRLLAGGDTQSALVTQTLATQEGLAVGDSISLNGTVAAGPQAYRIVGIVDGDGPLPEADGRVVLMPLTSAQTLFSMTGVTRVDVGVAAGTSVDELIGQLDVSITAEPYLISRTDDLAAALRIEMADFRGALLLVAAVVLFAGAFLIFNTLSMTVVEQTREVGLLRAAGTTRAQVMGLVLLQALALGVLGSVVGVGAGIGLAVLTLSWVGSSGPILLTAPAFSAGSIAMALIIGVVVTIAASLEPAWRAGRITPVEALRRGPPGAAASAARLRWLVVVFGVLAVVALAIWPSGQSGGTSGTGPLGTGADVGTFGPLAIYGLLLVAVLLVPRFLGPLVRVAGLPFRIFRNEERLARSSLSRDRSRTALTAGALVVGLAMVVALGTAAQDVRQIGASWLAETVPGSELLSSIRPVSMTDPIREELAATPGVKSISPIGLFGVPYVLTTQSGGRTQKSVVLQEAAAIVGSDYLADGRLNFVAGDRTSALGALDAGGSVIVPKSLADEAGIRLGDTLDFATGPTLTQLRVVGIVAHSIPAQAQEAIFVGWPDALNVFGVTGADFYAVRYAAGQESTARAALDSAAASYALEPDQLDRVSGTVGDALDRIFRLLDALALIAVLVAGLGMVNTLSMSVLERVCEIGVLRATGMTGRQVWGMVVIEAGILGLVGAIIGAVVGLLVGALLVAMSSAGFGLVFDPPWLSIALAVCFGVLISVTAAIYPAGLASRLSIVRALQHE